MTSILPNTPLNVRARNSALLLTSIAVSAILFSGCAASAKFTPQEQEMLDSMGAGQFQSRTAEEREAVETQPLFAQAAFWSREYDLNPSDLEAAIKLSSTLRRLGNPQKAAEIAQTTRSIYPRDLELVAEFAASLIALERGKDAIAPLSTAVRLETNNPRLWSLLGASHDQIGQYGKAREYYDRALRLSPNDSNVLANVGLSYALEGDARTAEVWLRRAASDPKASANIRQNLAIVLGLQGKYEEAEQLARQDLAADGAENNLAYLRSMNAGARSYEALESPQSAQPTANAAASARPQTTQNRQVPSYQQQNYQTQQAAPSQSSSTPRVYGGQPSNALQAAPAPSYQAQASNSNYAPRSQPAPTSAAAPSTYRAPVSAPSYPQGQQQTYTQPVSGQMSASAQAALAAAKSSAQNRTQTYTPPSHAQTQEQKDILAQISQSLAGKTAPRSDMTYRQMEEAYRQNAQQQSNAQMQAQQYAQQGYNQPNVNVQAYPNQNQYYAQQQQQAQAEQAYPQRRSALRTRE